MFGGKHFNPEKDIPSLDGKVILVTGGNTGLGKESILQLAKHHPKHIYLAARTASKAEAAIRDIKAAVPQASISHLSLDLTSFDSIKQAAETVKSQLSRLDILMNNAGIMACPYSISKEGYEIQFGINHVGHALLIKLLLPILLKTAEQPGADVRIINLSSEGHRMAPSGGLVFDQAALEKHGPWVRYGQSKLANILFSRELAKRYPSIRTVAVHPGVILTDLYEASKETNFVIRWGLNLVGSFFMGTVHEGAKNQLWAATAGKEEIVNGGYYTPIGNLHGGSRYAGDEKLAEKLWDWTEGQLEKHGF